METLPVWLMTIVGLLSIVMFIFLIASCIFVIFYLFLWEKMRAWFNKKAESEFMPKKRIERPQIIAAIIGVAMVILSIINSMIGPAKSSAEITPLAIISGLIQYGALIWFGIYCRNTYKDRVAQMSKKAAKWSVIYLLCSCVTIILLSAALTGFVIAIYALFFIFDKLWDFSNNSGTSVDSAKSSASQYRCCSSCKRFSYGKCNDDQSATISDPSHHCCGSYTA